jgi:hypothetical protein
VLFFVRVVVVIVVFVMFVVVVARFDPWTADRGARR